jgi:hypothetical protein
MMGCARRGASTHARAEALKFKRGDGEWVGR